MEPRPGRLGRLAATGKLAFGIAHEVNNPLGGILNYAHLLAEDLGEKSPLLPTAQKIIKLTDRCKIIVRNLLDFARQDAPNREAMDLNQLLGEMLSLIEEHIIIHGVEVVKGLEAGLPLFYGQRVKLDRFSSTLWSTPPRPWRAKACCGSPSAWTARPSGCA